ncbi:hypothetical protein BJQ90_00015 [Arthrobacter sp. SO3]|nr:hypothetical protein [Arthrobacter sp. SO3]
MGGFFMGAGGVAAAAAGHDDRKGCRRPDCCCQRDELGAGGGQGQGAVPRADGDAELGGDDRQPVGRVLVFTTGAEDRCLIVDADGPKSGSPQVTSTSSPTHVPPSAGKRAQALTSRATAHSTERRGWESAVGPAIQVPTRLETPTTDRVRPVKVSGIGQKDLTQGVSVEVGQTQVAVNLAPERGGGINPGDRPALRAGRSPGRCCRFAP